MSKCIYLKKTDQELTFDAEEHIFPAGIGGITKLKLGMVSDEFNTKIFSPIELDFMRNSPISIPRQIQGPGKRGSLSEKKATKSNVHVLYKNGNEEAALGYLSLGHPYLIPQIKIINKKEVHISFDKNEGDYLQQITKFINELKVFNNQYTTILDKDLPIDDILIGFYNGKWYLAKNNNCPEPVLSEFISHIVSEIDEKKHQIKYDSSLVTCHQKMTFNMENVYRVIAKIVFNFLAHSKGTDFVLQECFDPIREWIVKGGENRFVADVDQNKTGAIFQKQIFPKYSHWLGITKVNNKLIGNICLYGSYQYAVMLSDSFMGNYECDGLICDWQLRREFRLIDFISNICKG